MNILQYSIYIVLLISSLILSISLIFKGSISTYSKHIGLIFFIFAFQFALEAASVYYINTLSTAYYLNTISLIESFLAGSILTRTTFSIIFPKSRNTIFIFSLLLSAITTSLLFFFPLIPVILDNNFIYWNYNGITILFTTLSQCIGIMIIALFFIYAVLKSMNNSMKNRSLIISFGFFSLLIAQITINLSFLSKSTVYDYWIIGAITQLFGVFLLLIGFIFIKPSNDEY